VITLEVGGETYTGWVGATVTRSHTSLANEFSFVASAVGGVPPFKRGDRVDAYVDRERILSGFVERVSGSDDDNRHTVTYSGRDRTADLIDSQLDTLGDIRAGGNLTLKSIIERVITHLGLTLYVYDNFNPPPFNEAEDIVTPEVGMGALELVLKYAAKRQAVLSSTPAGNVRITSSTASDSGAAVQRIAGSPSNNILSQTWDLDDSQRFSRYVRRGQPDVRALNLTGGSSPEGTTSQAGGVTDGGVRAGRQSVGVPGQGYSSAELKQLALWARQLAEAKATRFNCVVRGHSNSAGAVWDTNTLVQVNSDVADITRKMLLDNVVFSEGEGGETATALSFVERNVYDIEAAIGNSKKAGKQSDGFKLDDGAIDFITNLISRGPD